MNYLSNIFLILLKTPLICFSKCFIVKSFAHKTSLCLNKCLCIAIHIKMKDILQIESVMHFSFDYMLF